MFFRKSRKIRKLEREVSAWKDAYADLGQEHVKLLEDHSRVLDGLIKDNKNHNTLYNKIDGVEKFIYAQLQEVKDLSERVNISKTSLIYDAMKSQPIVPIQSPEPSIEFVNNNPTKKRNTRAEIGKVIKVKKTGDEGLITFIFRDKKPLSYEIVLNNKEKLTLKRNQFDVL